MATKLGLGIVAAYESATPGTYTTIGTVFEFTGPELTVETVDTTSHAHTDGHRRFIAGLMDGGEVTMMIEFDPALSLFGALDTIVRARAVKNFKFTYPGGTVNTVVPAIVTGLGRETPIDDKMTIAVALKVAAPVSEAAS